MLDEFIKELEDLLHSTPYTGVDILPLVNKYTEDKDQEETSRIRLRIRSIIDQLKEDKLIEPGSNYHFQFATRFAGQYSQDPIIIRSTLKFEKELKARDEKPPQPITNFITHGDNSPIAGHDLTIGDIVQSSSKNLDLNSPQAEPSNQPEIKASNIKKALSYIGDHIIKIIVGLIILYLAIKLGLKK